jgi:hypothetical protein
VASLEDKQDFLSKDLYQYQEHQQQQYYPGGADGSGNFLIDQDPLPDSSQASAVERVWDFKPFS